MEPSNVGDAGSATAGTLGTSAVAPFADSGSTQIRPLNRRSLYEVTMRYQAVFETGLNSGDSPQWGGPPENGRTRTQAEPSWTMSAAIPHETGLDHSKNWTFWTQLDASDRQYRPSEAVEST